MQIKMQRLCWLSGFLLSILITTSPADGAFPVGAPLLGPSGLGTIPTPETVSPGAVQLGLGYERVKPNFGRVNFFPEVTGTYGFRRGEVGAGYLRERTSASGFSDSSDNFTLHGKYRVYENTRRGAAVAFGGHYLHFDEGEGHVTTLYAVSSSRLLKPRRGYDLRGHLGLLYQRISVDRSQNKLRPMVGLELRLRRGVTLAADYVPKSGDVARTMSLLVRYETPSGWAGQFGIGKLRNDTKLFASATYQFGGQ